MNSKEPGVIGTSDFYPYMPSQQAVRAFFYPVCVGRFSYAPGYCLQRSSYDSILVMYMVKGSCRVETEEFHSVASAGQIVILDCYRPHKYCTDCGWEALWLHFDGVLAMEYYKMIVGSHGNIFSLKTNYTFEKYLTKLYDMFCTGSAVREPLASKYITNLLSEMLLNIQDTSEAQTSGIIEETIAYISEHLTERLTLDSLAGRASLSPYYFTRLFKRETGYTPHEYIILSRINSAKYLLKNTTMSVKEIAFCSGFTSESGFCSTFRQWEHVTPSNYRAETI